MVNSIKKVDSMKRFVHIFDLDGTILDSNPAWEETNRKFLEYYGIVSEDCSKLATMSYESLYKHLLTLSLPDIGIERFRDEQDKIAAVAYSNTIPEKKEVTDYIKHLAKEKERLALFTGSPERLYRPALERIGIISFFSEFYSTDVTGYEKSSPEAWFDLSERLGVSLSEMVVYEDSPAALISAQKAGVCNLIWVEDRYSGVPLDKDIHKFSDIIDSCCCLKYNDKDIEYEKEDLKKRT